MQITRCVNVFYYIKKTNKIRTNIFFAAEALLPKIQCDFSQDNNLCHA
jgi:hypothetical protein